MTTTEKQSVSSGRGGLQSTPSVDLLRSCDGALGGLTKEALERATGSPEIKGNSIRLQFDGPVTFDAWLEAIAGGQTIRTLRELHPSKRSGRRAFREVLLEKGSPGGRGTGPL